MEMAFILGIIAIFLFSFFGVIWLLKRTGNINTELKKLRQDISALRNSMTAPCPAKAAGTVEIKPAAEAVPSPPPALETKPAAVSRSGAGIAAFIHSGNMWAAGGVLLLIAAFAMLMTYMARQGFFTLEMRIAAAALAGILMLVSGWVLRKRRPLYFLILQGGGTGILYLTVFAAYKLAGFPVQAAFVLMSLLIPAAVIIALFQNSQVLAFFGFLGGFAAPILLSTGEGSVAFLFGYYTILSLGILAISFFRPWKFTALLGFTAAFGISLRWIFTAYAADTFVLTGIFLSVFIVLYTLQGMILLIKNPGTSGGARGLYLESLLILGTPFLGALGQWKVFSVIRHGYSLASFIFAVFYLMTAFVLLGIRRKYPQGRAIPAFLIEAYGALALFLANLMIPLELSGSLTMAIWAAEGVLVYYLGIRSKNIRILLGGLIIHAAAAVDFMVETPGAIYGPLRSAAFTGALLIAVSAFVILALTIKSKETPEQKPLVFLSKNWYRTILVLWILLWWFIGWGMELGRILINGDSFMPWFFITASASALLFFVLSKPLGLAVLNLAAAPSLVIACAGMLRPLGARAAGLFFNDPTAIFTYNYFAGPWLWGWLSFAAVHGGILILSRKRAGTETDPAGNSGIPGQIPRPDPRSGIVRLSAAIRAPWTFAGVLIILPVLTASLRYGTSSLQLAPSWTALAGIGPLLTGLLVISFFSGRIAGMEKNFRLFTGVLLPWILGGTAALWFTITLFMYGNPAPLPLYIPVLNPLELQEALCAAGVILSQTALRRAGLPSLSRPGVLVLADVMGFFWLAAMLARSVHFFGNIHYSVLLSDAFNLGLFILAALWGIGHIILGHRLALRSLWIAGTILTVMDVGKLLLFDMATTGTAVRIASFFIAGIVLLFIGWAAPVPPALKKGQP
ncbi:MAG: DUF2339 domain-containing protein [Spirochaetaceae bacterium]|jgi:uncharacterized membrane protein|nr:DUF2339 domain-containing protein [Spirochaetaceae bacterium]